jgi:hypothetical protein
VPRVRQALLALEFAMPPLSGRLAPFTSLDAAGRDAVLADLRGSRFALRRTLFNAVRSFAAIGYYGSRASRAGVGYPEQLGHGRPGIEDAMRWSDPPGFPDASGRG